MQPQIKCPYQGDMVVPIMSPTGPQCPTCGRTIPNLVPPPPPIPPVSSRANTFKLSTFLLIVGAVVFSWTIVGLIVCGVGAYFSYKNDWPI